MTIFQIFALGYGIPIVATIMLMLVIVPYCRRR